MEKEKPPRALGWLIRLSGVSLALVFGLFALAYGAAFVMVIFVSDWKQNLMLSLVAVALGLILFGFSLAMGTIGYQMARQITRTTVDNFSLLAAALFAWLCYGLYPQHWQGVLLGYEVSALLMTLMLFLSCYLVLKYVLCCKFKLD